MKMQYSALFLSLDDKEHLDVITANLDNYCGGKNTGIQYNHFKESLDVQQQVGSPVSQALVAHPCNPSYSGGRDQVYGS
jgi:hypothetical protein